MKKSVFILIFIPLFILAFLVFKSTQYTITEPYEYPLLPDTPQRETASKEEKGTASVIPFDIAAKMTTDALLESYLNYPKHVALLSPSTQVSYINSMLEKEENRLGLNELIARDDLWESIIKRYDRIEVYTDKKVVIDKEQYDNFHDRIFLEVLAANERLPDNRHRKRFEEKLKEKYLDMWSNPNFYGEVPFDVTYESERFWEEMRQKHNP